MLADILFGGGKVEFIDIIISVLSSLIVIFLTMPIHEFAHAYAATKLGDPTPKFSGRLSLNPFNHIDYLGALCILIFGFGWAKPVEVNPRNFRNVKTGMAITAFAGPLSNIMVAFVSSFIYYALLRAFYATGIAALVYVSQVFVYIALINASLAVFNLIPIPPLDGSRIMGVILPDRIYYRLMQYERYLYFLVIILIVVGALDAPLIFLREKLMDVVTFIPSRIFF